MLRSDATVAALRRRIQARDVSAYAELAAYLIMRDDCTVELTRDRGPCAYPTTRRIVCGPIVDEASFVKFFHEYLHIIAGQCPRTFPHEAHMSGTTENCLFCESENWRDVAAFMPLSRHMAELVRRKYLGSYRRAVPAPMTAKQAADRQLSNLTWAASYQQHFHARDLYERQARIEAQVARDRADWYPHSVTALRARLDRAMQSSPPRSHP